MYRLLAAVLKNNSKNVQTNREKKFKFRVVDGYYHTYNTAPDLHF